MKYRGGLRCCDSANEQLQSIESVFNTVEPKLKMGADNTKLDGKRNCVTKRAPSGIHAGKIYVKCYVDAVGFACLARVVLSTNTVNSMQRTKR